MWRAMAHNQRMDDFRLILQRDHAPEKEEDVTPYLESRHDFEYIRENAFCSKLSFHLPCETVFYPARDL